MEGLILQEGGSTITLEPGIGWFLSPISRGENLSGLNVWVGVRDDRAVESQSPEAEAGWWEPGASGKGPKEDRGTLNKLCLFPALLGFPVGQKADFG